MTIKLGIDSYSQCYIEKMNSFYPNLWEHFDILPSFSEEKGNNIISYLLEIGCQATHIGNIRLGRESILSLPRDWVVERINDIAHQTLNLNDEWEFRRLLEIYELLDKNLFVSMCQFGKQCENLEIREAANDFTLCHNFQS
jgi:hypothetical protein